MALSNSTGLVSDAGGDTEETAAGLWLSLVRGRESLLGGSAGPVELDDRESDEGALTSLVWTGPASAWTVEAGPEDEPTAGGVRFLVCCPGDTCMGGQGGGGTNSA